jgi:uncharacterized membrane protein
MVGEKINLPISPKKKIVAIFTCVSIIITAIFEYFLFFFLDFVERTYSYGDESIYPDDQFSNFVNLFLMIYLIMEIVFTIFYVKGIRKSQILLFVTTLIHFIAQIFLVIKYSYGDYFCISSIFITLIIDFYLFWTLKKNWFQESDTATI